MGRGAGPSCWIALLPPPPSSRLVPAEGLARRRTCPCACSLSKRPRTRGCPASTLPLHALATQHRESCRRRGRFSGVHPCPRGPLLLLSRLDEPKQRLLPGASRASQRNPTGSSTRAGGRGAGVGGGGGWLVGVKQRRTRVPFARVHQLRLRLRGHSTELEARRASVGM